VSETFRDNDDIILTRKFFFYKYSWLSFHASREIQIF